MTYTFADHGSDGELPKHRLYYLGLPTPVASVAAPISAGANTVTPSSMTGVYLGALLSVMDVDQSHAEVVTVTAVAPTTFSATFVDPHAAGWIFNSSAPLYWTDHRDFDIEWNGHRWLSQPITPGAISNQPDGQSGTFKIADADNVIFPILAGTNGGELSLAEIWEAAFSPSNKTPVPDDVVQVFSGRVDSAKATTDQEDSIEFTLMPPVQSDAGELPSRLISTLVREYASQTDSFTSSGGATFTASLTPVRTVSVTVNGFPATIAYGYTYTVSGSVLTVSPAPTSGLAVTWTYFHL